MKEGKSIDEVTGRLGSDLTTYYEKYGILKTKSSISDPEVNRLHMARASFLHIYDSNAFRYNLSKYEEVRELIRGFERVYQRTYQNIMGENK